MEKKLTRSRTNRKIAGVCGGLGEYFDIDPTILRLLWIVFSFAIGFGIIIYLICAIIIPNEPEKIEDLNKQEKLENPKGSPESEKQENPEE